LSHGWQVAHLKAVTSASAEELEEQVDKARAELTAVKDELGCSKEDLNKAAWQNKMLTEQAAEGKANVDDLEKQLGAALLRQQQLEVMDPAFRALRA
jgi:chromosome segregation ATPase